VRHRGWQRNDAGESPTGGNNVNAADSSKTHEVYHGSSPPGKFRRRYSYLLTGCDRPGHRLTPAPVILSPSTGRRPRWGEPNARYRL